MRTPGKIENCDKKIYLYDDNRSSVALTENQKLPFSTVQKLLTRNRRGTGNNKKASEIMKKYQPKDCQILTFIIWNRSVTFKDTHTAVAHRRHQTLTESL